jgi:hypothetical protein
MDEDIVRDIVKYTNQRLVFNAEVYNDGHK